MMICCACAATAGNDRSKAGKTEAAILRGTPKHAALIHRVLQISYLRTYRRFRPLPVIGRLKRDLHRPRRSASTRVAASRHHHMMFQPGLVDQGAPWSLCEGLFRFV